MEDLDGAMDDFIYNYPKLTNNLMGIITDNKYPVTAKQIARQLKSEIGGAMQNVHSNNRASFQTQDELFNYIDAAGDLLAKATTAEVFINSAMLKKLRDIDGVSDRRIDDFIIGLDNKYRLINESGLDIYETRENAARLRDLIDETNEYLLNPPSPRRTRRTRRTNRSGRSRRYTPFSRRSRRTPSGGNKK